MHSYPGTRTVIHAAIVTVMLMLANVASARIADIQINVAEITGYGLFEFGRSTRYSGFSKRTMAADTVSGVKFTEYTNEVPGRVGVNFGFEYTINSTPRGARIPIRSIIRFPEPGLQQPSGKHYTESIEKTHVIIGDSSLHGYGFDEAWEVVPGEWVFEIWYKDARLIRKTFTVVEETGE